MPSADDSPAPRRRGFRLTLKARFALLAVAFVAVLGGVNRYYVEWRLIGEVEREFENRSLVVARYLAAQSVDLILYGDRVALEGLLSRGIASSEDLVYALVEDPSHQAVAHTFEDTVPNEIARLPYRPGEGGYQSTHMPLEGEAIRDITVPVYEGKLGTLHLGVDDGAIAARVARVRDDLLLLLLAVVVMAAAAAYWLARRWIRPLEGVASALARFEPGRHRVAIPIERDDEIGDLAGEINTITARLNDTQESMVRAEKLASIGVMAAGIAHEMANPISGIQNCLQRISEHPEDVDQTKEYVAAMTGSADHMASVVRGLLQFARGDETEVHETMDLRATVDHALALTAIRLDGGRIEVLRRGSEEPINVQGDPSKLAQVFVNLILNAADAMPEGGGIEIDVQRQDGQGVVSVKDDGVGIAKDDVSRIFDPFFTTKAVGAGTGLGLSVVHRIVEDHRGSIKVESVRGGGTRFIVSLPALGDTGGVA